MEDAMKIPVFAIVLFTMLLICSSVFGRALNPQTGRWLTRDPAGYVGGANVYQYARGQPVRLRDPDGLCARGCGSPKVSASLIGVGDVPWLMCMSHVRECMQNDPVVMALWARLAVCAAGNPNFHLPSIDCRFIGTLDSRREGQYYCDRHEIVMNPWEPGTYAGCSVLAHEISHAVDDCEWGGNCALTQDCDAIACSEIIAANRSGQCCNAPDYAKCVNDGALRSVGDTRCDAGSVRRNWADCFEPTESPCPWRFGWPVIPIGGGIAFD